MARYAIGLDFGTEAVRAVVVDIRTGDFAGQASSNYPHGVIDRALPAGGPAFPADYALQHPQDWRAGMGLAGRGAMRAGGGGAEEVVGIGIDFTSCTMLPAL